MTGIEYCTYMITSNNNLINYYYFAACADYFLLTQNKSDY